MADDIFRKVTFDSEEITFDSCEYTWDNCSSQQQIIKQYLKISGGTALVVAHGPENKLYSRLDTYQDFSFSITLTNPMFNDVGSHSIPFSIPASGHNLKIFGFPARIERYTEFKNKEYPFYIYAEGLHILTGMLVVTSAVPDSIECYFKSGNGDFWSAIKGKYLTDIELGESPEFATMTDAELYMKQSTVKAYPEVPFAMFPLLNYGMSKDFTEDEMTDATKGAWRGVTMVNYWYPPLQKFLLEYSSVTPFLYLNYVIEKLWDTFGYSTSNNFLRNDDELNRLVMYNNHSSFWYDTAGNNPFIPFVDPAVYPRKFDYGKCVQKYDISKFIQGIENLFCATLFVNDRLKEVKLLLFKDIINSKDSVKFSKVVSDIQVTISEPYDSFRFTFENDTSAYHESDIKDFQKQRRFFTAVFPLPATGGSLTQVNDLWLVLAKDIYYRVEYSNEDPPVLTWKRFSKNIRKELGDETGNCLHISSEIFTLPMFYGPDVFNGAMIGGDPTPYTKVSWPKAHQRFYFDLQKDDQEPTNEFSPRLLFYRGLQLDESTPKNLYPLGTFDVFGTNKINGVVPKLPGATLRLQWDGDDGLVENFYKEFLQWKMAGPDKLEFEAWMDVTELAALDFSRKYAINHVHMLLDTVEFSISNTGVTRSKVTAYKV
jgi:hypothetical protein